MRAILCVLLVACSSEAGRDGVRAAEADAWVEPDPGTLGGSCDAGCGPLEDQLGPYADAGLAGVNCFVNSGRKAGVCSFICTGGEVGRFCEDIGGTCTPGPTPQYPLQCLPFR